jgi:hypothetical protein
MGKEILKIILSFFLILAIAIVLQSYIDYIQVKKPGNWLIVPVTTTCMVLAFWLVCERNSIYRKFYRNLSIIAIILTFLWLLLVMYMEISGSNWNRQ